MTTERREYPAQDIEQVNKAEEQLRAKGLDEGSQRIVDLLDAYFQSNPSIPVTVANVVKLVEAQPGLKWLSPAELEYRRIAAENPAAADKLAAWFATQGGRPGTLVNTGDLYFQNASNLLQELRGRDVNSATIDEAISRIETPTSKFSTRKRPPLHFVPQSRPQDPRQHQSDGTGFLGKEEVNEPHWKRVQREREARDAANQQSGVSAQSVAVRDAQQKAEQLRGNTHSESEQIARLFVTTSTNEIDWVQTLAARLNLQQSLNKAREVRRFIR
jgi:hypothetical protein